MRSPVVSRERPWKRQILNKSSSSSFPHQMKSSPAASGHWTEQMVQLGQICGRRTISRLICKGKGSARRYDQAVTLSASSAGVRQSASLSPLMNDTTASLRQYYVSGAISESINYGVLQMDSGCYDGSNTC